MIPSQGEKETETLLSIRNDQKGRQHHDEGCISGRSAAGCPEQVVDEMELPGWGFRRWNLEGPGANASSPRCGSSRIR